MSGQKDILPERVSRRSSCSGCDSSSSSGESGCVRHQGALLQQLAGLLDTGEFSDTVLVVNGHKVVAHKAILAARCDYFRAMFFGGMAEASRKEVVIQGAEIHSFRALLRYIYCGSLQLGDLREETVISLVGLAHQFGLVSLQSALSRSLQRRVCRDNVSSLLDLASLYQIDHLLSACQLFFDRHAPDMLRHPSLCHLSPSSLRAIVERDSFFAPEMEIFEGVRAWVAANTDATQHCAVIEAIRLPLIDMKELVGVVRNSGICESDRILDAIQQKVQRKNHELDHRGRLLPDENVASEKHAARGTRGEMAQKLVDGNSSDYNRDEGFARCGLDPSSDPASDSTDDNHLQVELGCAHIINHIKFLLWDRDDRSYCYVALVSMDGLDWVVVADYSSYFCRSWQLIYFEPRAVRYIRLVGRKNTANFMFHVVALEAYYLSQTERVQDCVIVPESNVATVARCAAVVEGVSRSRHALIDGRLASYDWDHGFTCHRLGSGDAIVVQLAQPVLVDSMRLLLWDGDDRCYSYYVEVSVDRQHWVRVCDRTEQSCRSWQSISFSRRVVVFIRLVGTRNTVNEVFHCVHLECPARHPDCSSEDLRSACRNDRAHESQAAAVAEFESGEWVDEELEVDVEGQLQLLRVADV